MEYLPHSVPQCLWGSNEIVLIAEEMGLETSSCISTFQSPAPGEELSGDQTHVGGDCFSGSLEVDRDRPKELSGVHEGAEQPCRVEPIPGVSAVVLAPDLRTMFAFAMAQWLRAAGAHPIRNVGVTARLLNSSPKHQPKQPMKKPQLKQLSNFCLILGFASIAVSIAVWYLNGGPAPEAQAHAERFGIFVGLWAPTFFILSNRFDRYAEKSA